MTKVPSSYEIDDQQYLVGLKDFIKARKEDLKEAKLDRSVGNNCQAQPEGNRTCHNM